MSNEHYEKLRNDPKVKIDILDDDIWTPEEFQDVPGKNQVTGRGSGPPGG